MASDFWAAAEHAAGRYILAGRMYYAAGPSTPVSWGGGKPGKVSRPIYSAGTTQYKGITSKQGQQPVCLNTCKSVRCVAAGCAHRRLSCRQAGIAQEGRSQMHLRLCLQAKNGVCEDGRIKAGSHVSEREARWVSAEAQAAQHTQPHGALML